MHYIITDIHNDNRRFTELLQKINLTERIICICWVICLTGVRIMRTLWVYTSRC